MSEVALRFSNKNNLHQLKILPEVNLLLPNTNRFHQLQIMVEFYAY